MNSTWDRMDNFQDAFLKNFILVFLAIIFNYFNAIIVFISVTNQVFYTEARYILYVNLVIGDMILMTTTVALHVVSYIAPFFKISVCCVVLIIADTAHKNTPLNLVGMAIERYIAICAPLRHAQVCTARRTFNVLAITWCMSAIPVFTDVIIMLSTQPSIFYYRSVMCFNITVFNTPYHSLRITVVLVIYLSSVWLCFAYTYARVVFAVKATKADPISAKKAQKTILFHAVQVMLCMLSYIIPWCNAFFLPLFPGQRTTILFSTFFIANVIPRILTPLLYGIRDQKLFAHIKGYFLHRLDVVKRKPTEKHLVRAENKY